MLTDDGKHLYVSWDEYHLLTERLALKVHASGWEFDQILCLARGGMRPGDVLSRVFDKPLGIMSTSSYRAESGTVQGHLDIARYITTPKGEIAGKVLLVDDLADTGHTLKAVVDQLKNNYKLLHPSEEFPGTVIVQAGTSEDGMDISARFAEVIFSAHWSIEACKKYSREVKARAADKFGVTSTPTLFINGKMQKGGVSIDDLAKIIDPLIKS